MGPLPTARAAAPNHWGWGGILAPQHLRNWLSRGHQSARPGGYSPHQGHVHRKQTPRAPQHRPEQPLYNAWWWCGLAHARPVKPHQTPHMAAARSHVHCHSAHHTHPPKLHTTLPNSSCLRLCRHDRPTTCARRRAATFARDWWSRSPLPMWCLSPLHAHYSGIPTDSMIQMIGGVVLRGGQTQAG